MTCIIPHINTLIIDIGSELTKIGYTGDFRPSLVFKTDRKDYSPLENADRKDFSLLESKIKESGLDSILFIDNGFISNSEILKFLFPNKLCNSVLFLKYEIASLFGFGKVTGIVFNCSPSNISTTVVMNGKIVENHRCENKSILGSELISIDEKIFSNCADEKVTSNSGSGEEKATSNSATNEKIVSNSTTDTSKNTTDEKIVANIGDEYDAVINDNVITATNDNVEDDLLNKLTSDKSVIENIEFIYKMRSKYNLNKKNAANGCVVLSGGFFKSESFYKLIRKILLSKIGEDFGDFILREKDLDCVFSGASIFGMNNHSKALFISSYDWKEMGTEVLKKKSLSS